MFPILSEILLRINLLGLVNKTQANMKSNKQLGGEFGGLSMKCYHFSGRIRS